MMNGTALPLLVLAALLAASLSSSRVSAQRQQAWDERFRALPDAAAIGQYMQRLSARPHHVGAPYGKDNAEWMLARFKEWGWDAKIESYDVLFPTPKERLLEMTAPTRFRAALEEPAVTVDPTSGQKSEQLPTYNAYSVDGDVTAPLVYVNYGRPEDYEELEAAGVSVKGAIVIARYGGSFRGTKPKIAAEHGAVGCIIYSDPRDDGYFADAVFPEGPMRSQDGVQRGSVIDLPQYSGDPLTPGTPSVPGVRHLDIKDAQTLTPGSSTAVPWRSSRAAWLSGLQMPTCCRSSSRTSPTRRRVTSASCRTCCAKGRTTCASATGRSTTVSSLR